MRLVRPAVATFLRPRAGVSSDKSTAVIVAGERFAISIGIRAVPVRDIENVARSCSEMAHEVVGEGSVDGREVHRVVIDGVGRGVHHFGFEDTRQHEGDLRGEAGVGRLVTGASSKSDFTRGPAGLFAATVFEQAGAEFPVAVAGCGPSPG